MSLSYDLDMKFGLMKYIENVIDLIYVNTSKLPMHIIHPKVLYSINEYLKYVKKQTNQKVTD